MCSFPSWPMASESRASEPAPALGADTDKVLNEIGS